MQNELHLLGYASGLAGASPDCGNGPRVMKESPFMQQLQLAGVQYHWNNMVAAETALPIYDAVKEMTQTLANHVASLLNKEHFFCVLGGDHSCAIGTWSGVHSVMHHKGDIGLVWIDAHMDSHTPATTPSGRIHGMPLAVLLGQGDPRLTSLKSALPKFKAENVCLIGARSFEPEEEQLLKTLKVRIYYMDEIKQRGFQAVLDEAVQTVKKNTIGYGISFDLDSIDPKEAPAVDVPEPDGLHFKDVIAGFESLSKDEELLGLEIVEFDPKNDKSQMTEKGVVALLQAICKE